MLRNNRHHGYVLVTTLLLVAIAAVAMASLARASLHRATAALDAESELQRRWGSISISSAVLPKVEQLLSRVEQAEGRPVARIEVELGLGKQRQRLILSDEQAKLNVNAMYRRRGPIQAEQATRELLQQASYDLRLRPFAARGRTGPTEVVFATFDELLENASADDLAGLRDGWHLSEPAAQQLTLWGDEQVQFQRASDEVIEKVCEGVTGPGDVYRLLAIRQEDPLRSVSAALDELQPAREVRQRLQTLLTDASTCKSIWIVTDDGRRRWHELIVEEGAAAGLDRHRFAW
jgi:hypothetical protein